MKHTRAFSYLRVSSEGQEQGDGFARQRSKIKGYAEKNRIEIVEEFKDKMTSVNYFFSPTTIRIPGLG